VPGNKTTRLARNKVLRKEKSRKDDPPLPEPKDKEKIHNVSVPLPSRDVKVGSTQKIKHSYKAARSHVPPRKFCIYPTPGARSPAVEKVISLEKKQREDNSSKGKAANMRQNVDSATQNEEGFLSVVPGRAIVYSNKRRPEASIRGNGGDVRYE